MSDVPETDLNGPGLRIHPSLIYMASMLVGTGLEKLHPLPMPFRLPGTATGVILIGIAGAIAIWALLQFHRAETDVRTDTPDDALITGGPYRFTRNPLYIVLTLTQVTAAFWLDSLWILVLTPASVIVITAYAITREERYLEKRFGQEYLDYKKRVRRWL
jgi:protein-S-isoprenylcysteine O-methyltransferase Ste14